MLMFILCKSKRGGQSGQFRIVGCIMSTWLFNVYMDGVKSELSGIWESRYCVAFCMHMT